MNNHPISEQKAKELMAGPLAQQFRKIVSESCVPIYWFRTDQKPTSIAHSGTLTIVKTPQRLLGVTAAHVIEQLSKDAHVGPVRVQLMNAVIDDVLDRVIDFSADLDLVTIDLDPTILEQLGKAVTPLSTWPPAPPDEGKGIMIGGYPAGAIVEEDGNGLNFGLFTILGVARTVTPRQITWLAEVEFQLENAEIPPPPPEYELGGISGGPLIGWFESESFVSHYRLSGIVTQHPDYMANEFSIERLVAIRADAITESGRIVPS